MLLSVAGFSAGPHPAASPVCGNVLNTLKRAGASFKRRAFMPSATASIIFEKNVPGLVSPGFHSRPTPWLNRSNNNAPKPPAMLPRRGSWSLFDSYTAATSHASDNVLAGLSPALENVVPFGRHAAYWFRLPHLSVASVNQLKRGMRAEPYPGLPRADQGEMTHQETPADAMLYSRSCFFTLTESRFTNKRLPICSTSILPCRRHAYAVSAVILISLQKSFIESRSGSFLASPSILRSSSMIFSFCLIMISNGLLISIPEFNG